MRVQARAGYRQTSGCRKPWVSVVTRPLCRLNPNSRLGVESPHHKVGSMQTISEFATFVGIDVSRDRLDVHVLPENLSFSVPNTPPGARRLIGVLSNHADVLVVLEASCWPWRAIRSP